MITFAHPQYLYLLLIIPAILALSFMARVSRNRKLAKFGRKKSVDSLMPEVSKYMPWVKLSIELLAVAFVIIAIARPRMQADETNSPETEKVRGMEIMLCVDVSNSMLASSTDDPNGISRMQRAKMLMEKLLNGMSDDKVGLIVFAGESYTQLPVTSDIVSAKMFVNTLSPGMVSTQGTAIGTALEMAANSFTPESPFEKAIVLITDAENFEDDALSVAKKIASSGIQIDVIGMGTSHPVPIPVTVNGSRGYMNDAEGNMVRTALNEQLAIDIAKAGNGIYINGAESNASQQLDNQLDKLAKTEYERLGSNPMAEQFPVFAWIALILLLVDVFLPYRKIMWLTHYTFFKKQQ